MDAQQNQNQDTTGSKPVEQQNLSDLELRDQAIKAAEDSVQVPVKPTEPTVTVEDKPDGGLDAKKLALQVARLEKQMRDNKASSDKTREEYEKLVNRLKDPEQRYALIEEHGGNYQDWTEKIVSGSKPQRDQRDVKIDQLEQSLQRLQDQLEQRNQSEQKQVQERSLTEANQYALKYVEDNKDKYPLLHAMRRSDILVQEAIRRHDEGLSLDDAEIASDIEGRIVETIKGELKNMIELDVIKNYLTELGYKKVAQTVQEKELTQRDSNRGQTNQTLTNDLSGEPSSGFDYSKATDDELRSRAIKIAEQAAADKRRSA